MFKVNDYVIYNAAGVFKIIDIVKEDDINDEETKYYVLEPAYAENLRIKTPVKNRKITIRALLTKAEIMELIESIPQADPIWFEENRERNLQFKEILRSADALGWVKLIKGLRAERDKKVEAGKKLAKSDEDLLKAAEKNLYEEFATTLEIPVEEVPSFIGKYQPEF